MNQDQNAISVHSKKWGYEIWIENNDSYCGKHLHISPLKKCSVHYHKLKKETFYIIDGSLVIEYSTVLDKESWINMNDSIKKIVLYKGDSFTIDTNIAHRFYSSSMCSCDFIEISTHHDESDSYRIIDSI